VPSHWKSIHGKNLKVQLFQITGIGETLTEPITAHGTRISTFQSIVDHAGLKVPHPHLLTDSTFYSEIKTQLQLLSMLKQSSTAELVDLVKVETQVVFMSLLVKKEFQIPHASNMLHKIYQAENVVQLTSVRTAHGHHAQ